MKRFLAIALALMMIISIAPVAAVAEQTADEPETLTVDASGNNSNASAVTVTKKYFAVGYKMHYDQYAGKTGDNGCCGIIFNGDNIYGCVYLPYDGTNSGTSQKIANGTLRCGPWWGDKQIFGDFQNTTVSSLYNTDLLILILGEVDGTKLTVKAYLNGTAISVWGGSNEATTSSFTGQIGWKTALTDQSATFMFAESDSSLFNSATFSEGSYDATCAASADTMNSSQVRVTKKYFAAAYTIYYGAENGVSGGNGCCGIVIDDETSGGCVYVAFAGGVTPDNKLHFGPWWNGGSPYGADGVRWDYDISNRVGGEITILLLGTDNGNGTATFTCYLDGEQMNVWTGAASFTETFGGALGWATKDFGKKATFRFAQSDDKAFDTTAFADDITGKIGEINGGWTEGADGRSFTSKTGDIGWYRGSYYQLGSALDYELSATVSLTSQAGFVIGAADTNGNGYLDEVGDKYVLIDLQYADDGKRKLGVEINDMTWSGWKIEKTIDAVPENKISTIRAVVSTDSYVSVYVDGVLAAEFNYSSLYPEGNIEQGFGLWTKDISAGFTDVRATQFLESPDTVSDEFLGFYQTRTNSDGTSDLRLLFTALDSKLKDCAKCTFRFTFTDSASTLTTKEIDYTRTKAYKLLTESGTYVAFGTFEGLDDYHIIGCVIENIPSSITNISVSAVLTDNSGNTSTYEIGSGILAD